MKALLTTALLLCAAPPVLAASWTYRGQLNADGQPANGRFDLRLTLQHRGKAYIAPLSVYGVDVRNGEFSAELELPLDPDTAPALELLTEVAPAGGNFEPLGAPIPFDAKSALAGVCWDTGGNTGINPATDFLGTTDAQPLVLRTRNAQSLRIEPGGILMLGGAPITNNLIAGSYANVVATGVRGATISGGGVPSGDNDPTYDLEAPNRINDHYGTIGGGYANTAGRATNGNLGDDAFATVAGGLANYAAGSKSAIGGGQENLVAGSLSVVAGGQENSAAGAWAAVAGGIRNAATTSANYAAIGGGYQNSADNNYGTVAGGFSNAANGLASAVPGGTLNCAGGDSSFAGGYRAEVRSGTQSANCGGGSGDANGDEGTFIWSDRAGNTYTSTGPNQFLVRATGGFALNTTPLLGADVEMTVQAPATGQDYASLWLKQRSANNNGMLLSVGDGSGSNNAGFYIDQYNGSTQARRFELAPGGAVTIRSNTTQANTGVTMAAGGGSWTSLSDRRVKTAIEAVDPGAILERVAALPISTWSYIAQGEGVRHIGPMAQDFKAAFEVGESDTGITTIDADGVALAAIQGLNHKLETENAALAADVDALKQQNQTLLERLQALEARLLAQSEAQP